MLQPRCSTGTSVPSPAFAKRTLLVKVALLLLRVAPLHDIVVAKRIEEEITERGEFSDRRINVTGGFM